MAEKIEIPLSKLKILILLVGSVIFVLLGVVFSFSPHTFITSRFSNPQLILIIGIIAALFFGLTTIFLIRKLFDRKAGLTFDQNGIIDNSSGTSVGRIHWVDIQGIDTLQIASTKFVLLITNQPEKYIARARNSLAKRAMKANYKIYGSPLCISSNALKIKFKDLHRLVVQEFQKSRPDPGHS